MSPPHADSIELPRPETSKALAEPFRKRRRAAEIPFGALGCVRRLVLAARWDSEQVFAVAGIGRGWRGREESGCRFRAECAV